MTVPGLGGQQPAPLNSAPADQLVPGVTPGTTGQIVASRVIIVGANGEILIYNPSIATGNLAVSITGPAGTGLAGDTVQAGVTVYASGGFPFAELNTGNLNFQATALQFSPAIIESFGVAGELGLTSGLATNTDNAANIIIDSAQASGIAVSLISLQSTDVSLNTFASSTIPSANAFPGHQSAAPATYNQSYEQATTNRVNEIMDVLTQCGIWHT